MLFKMASWRAPGSIMESSDWIFETPGPEFGTKLGLKGKPLLHRVSVEGPEICNCCMLLGSFVGFIFGDIC